jgi:hypothetical protein
MERIRGTGMPGRRKTFPCGHTGYGQFCHACVEKTRKAEQARSEREAWESAFESDPIDLRGFPKRIVLKAREVLARLAAGETWGALGGKLLRHDRTVVSIPVTREYRLLCRFAASTITPTRLESHEDYNGTKPGA